MPSLLMEMHAGHPPDQAGAPPKPERVWPQRRMNAAPPDRPTSKSLASVLPCCALWCGSPSAGRRHSNTPQGQKPIMQQALLRTGEELSRGSPCRRLVFPTHSTDLPCRPRHTAAAGALPFQACPQQVRGAHQEGWVVRKPGSTSPAGRALTNHARLPAHARRGLPAGGRW